MTRQKVECGFCHNTEEVEIAEGESFESGIECQVCDRGFMWPDESANSPPKGSDDE